jgi:hypothetical protein
MVLQVHTGAADEDAQRGLGAGRHRRLPLSRLYVRLLTHVRGTHCEPPGANRGMRFQASVCRVDSILCACCTERQEARCRVSGAV